MTLRERVLASRRIDEAVRRTNELRCSYCGNTECRHSFTSDLDRTWRRG